MQQHEQTGSGMTLSDERYPQDLIGRHPPLQEGKSLHDPEGLSAFALSLRGASHVKSGAPCQDYSDIREISGGWLLAAIADGVGSCKLSHWGAYIAVNTALDYLEHCLESSSQGLAENQIPVMLDRAFQKALEQVEAVADRTQTAVGNLQSTLTVALYNMDGTLHFCHIGDGGIVAQGRDGTVSLVTERMKGEEANSVYPLQTGTGWKYGKEKSIAAFTMATDGVLDEFAMDFPKMTYFHQIFYPMMEAAVYSMQPRGPSDQAEAALRGIKGELFLTPDYQKRVTDDITFVAVVSQPLLHRAKHPQFDRQIWEQELQKVKEFQQQGLRQSLGAEQAMGPRQTSPPQTRRVTNPAGEKHSPKSAEVGRTTYPASKPSVSRQSNQRKNKQFTILIVLSLCFGLLAGVAGTTFTLSRCKESSNALHEGQKESRPQEEVVPESDPQPEPKLPPKSDSSPRLESEPQPKPQQPDPGLSQLYSSEIETIKSLVITTRNSLNTLRIPADTDTANWEEYMENCRNIYREILNGIIDFCRTVNGGMNPVNSSAPQIGTSQPNSADSIVPDISGGTENSLSVEKPEQTDGYDKDPDVGREPDHSAEWDEWYETAEITALEDTMFEEVAACRERLDEMRTSADEGWHARSEEIYAAIYEAMQVREDAEYVWMNARKHLSDLRSAPKDEALSPKTVSEKPA